MKDLSSRKVLCLTIVLAFVLYDGRSHFDRSLIKTKLEYRSGQYHWNLFFPQKVIYQNSSFRYQNDFNRIEEIIRPESIVLSDFPTSHYVAANLPVYIKNTQPHQGRYAANPGIAKLFDKLDFCYMSNFSRKLKVLEVLAKDSTLTGRSYYILLNRDGINRNMHFECLVSRGQYVKKHLNDFTKLLYSGKDLDLYEVNFEAVNLIISSLKKSG